MKAGLVSLWRCLYWNGLSSIIIFLGTRCGVMELTKDCDRYQLLTDTAFKKGFACSTWFDLISRACRVKSDFEVVLRQWMMTACVICDFKLKIIKQVMGNSCVIKFDCLFHNLLFKCLSVSKIQREPSYWVLGAWEPPTSSGWNVTWIHTEGCVFSVLCSLVYKQCGVYMCLSVCVCIYICVYVY